LANQPEFFNQPGFFIDEWDWNPFYNCPPYDDQNIDQAQNSGQNFGCVRPTKASIPSRDQGVLPPLRNDPARD
jgi:hypothetical protein